MWLPTRLRDLVRRNVAASGHATRWGREVVATDPPKLYGALLGREPSARELEDARGRDLHDVARRIATSREARKRLGSGQVDALLAGSEPAVSTHPPGTASPDGVAVVGHDGWLFIAHGANDFVRQVAGEMPLTDTAIAAWTSLLLAQQDAAERSGARLAQLVIPDKLALYGDLFPRPLQPVGPRPIEQLLAAAPRDLLYPIDELRTRRAEAEVYFVTDSHTSPAGADMLYQSVMAQFGREPWEPALTRPLVQGVMLGDLGVKYTPKLHEVVDVPVRFPSIEMTRDNAKPILDLGGHLGVQRVTHNAQAPYDETCVIFGDSYSYIDLEAPGNLGELLAATFREVHFLWAPFCWDESYVREVRPDHVLMQMAERFAIMTPRGDVDVRELAAETIRRKAGVPPDEVAQILGDA